MIEDRPCIAAYPHTCHKEFSRLVAHYRTPATLWLSIFKHHQGQSATFRGSHKPEANQATMHLFLCSNAQKGPEGVKISHMVFISHAKKMWEKATHKGDKTVLSWYQTMRSKNVKGVFLWRVPEEKILSV